MFMSVPSDPAGRSEFSHQSGKILLDYVAAFIDFPKPLVSVVNGPAVGIATSILPLMDAVYASDR